MSTKNQVKNAQAKMIFFEYLQGAKGFTEQSVDLSGDVIFQWERFFEYENFANFNKTKALSFVRHLKERNAKTPSGHLALQTQYNYLRRIKQFFVWLADQPGYKSQINKNEVQFLRLSKKEVNIVTAGTAKNIPIYEDIQKVINSIGEERETDMRDRALICLVVTTGIRISALISLKMKSFDKQREIFDQNPEDGVKTKNSKRIVTTFCPIPWKEPREYFLIWYEYLEKKNSQPDDPIFPATKKGGFDNVIKGNVSISSFWKSPNTARKIFEKRFIAVNVPYCNPHSFRDFIIDLVSEVKLTEKEKKAISLGFGHADVGTTFGSYGSSGMSSEKAVEIVKGISFGEDNEEGLVLEQIKKIIGENMK